MKKVLIIIAAASITSLPLTAQDKPAATGETTDAQMKGLTADQIVDTVKKDLPVLPPLRGILKKSGKELPFVLKMTGSKIHISFENPEQHIHLDAGDKTSSLKEESDGSNKEVPAAQYGTDVRGTDLTYEDLSMRYLYWPKKVIIGEESIKTQKCYVVDLYNPQREGNYSLVRIFVRKASGAIMRMSCYDWNGKLLKSCFITAAMKISDAQGKEVIVLKTMEIVRYLPGTKKIAEETIVELLKPQK